MRAVAVEVGGGLRVFEADGVDVMEPYPLDALCDGAHGAILAPWPNRLADGRYTFDGRDLQLDLSEPARHNAIHGLVRWRAFTPVHQAADRVVLAHRLVPSPGYPFTLDLAVEYRLGPGGLTVTCSAQNAGPEPLPYALGQHPYLAAGVGGVDAARLRVGARTRIVEDAARRVPVGRAPTAGTSLDLAEGRPLAGVVLDDALADLDRDADGRAHVGLERADGRSLDLWLDDAFRYLQLYTGEDLAPARRRRALAVEPMTAPANAFATGEGRIRLEPGERHRASWGLGLA